MTTTQLVVIGNINRDSVEKIVSRSSTLFDRGQILLGEVWCMAFRPHKAVPTRLYYSPALGSHLLRISSSGGYCVIARVCVRLVSSSSTLLTLRFPDGQ
jgi:hypothetical protein